MATYDDRLAELERKVAALELRRLYEEGLAKENTPLEQGHNLREINENMTILLGVTGRQGQDIKAVQADLTTIKQEINSLHTKFDRLERLLLERLPPQ